MTATDTRGSAQAAVAEKPSTAQITRVAAGSHISRLQHGYLNDVPSTVGDVARIRRGAGKPVNAIPDVWGLTVPEDLYERLERQVREAELAKAENAVHIAVTLWAMHQQSRRDTPMHSPGGPRLGRAVRALMPGTEIDEPLRQRFVRMGTATSLEILAQRAREIVVLLRQSAQPMDYAELAKDLYLWQLPGQRTRIHQSWGRDFHAGRPATAIASAETANPGKDPS